MKEKNEIGLKRWGVLSAEKGAFDLRKAPLTGPEDYAVSYASFWVFSPRPLDDLHPKANVPKLDLELQTADNIEIWLNGKSVFKSEAGWTGDTLQAEGLPLKRGWNHLLIRTLNTQDDDEFQAQLVSSQPDFLNDLKSATERP